MKEKIYNAIVARVEALRESGEWALDDMPHVLVERPKDLLHGDYTTNIGFILAGQLKQAPPQIAQTVVDGLDIEGVAQMSVVGGYINFTLTRDALVSAVFDIENKGVAAYRTSNIYSDQKILVEHSSPNLFKPFHIGHLVNNTVGESVSRLMGVSGGDVTVISYPSDVSLGIAKAVWAAIEKGSEILFDETVSVREKMIFAGECYVYGTRAYDEREDVQGVIRAINKQIYAGEESEALRVYMQGKDLNLAYFKDVTTRLGSHFDGYIFESESGAAGKEIILEHVGEIFEESDGAVIYDGEKEGLHTRVFLNKEKLPTYEAKDIGLLFEKFARYAPDRSFFVTDHEQGPYFQVVLSAAGKINENWQAKSHHVMHGRLGFSGGKVSSRLGNVPLAEEVLDTVRSAVEEKMRSSDTAKAAVTNELLDQLAIGGLKFAILKTSLGKNMTFDEEESLSFEGDSGPYLQYTCARIYSACEKAAAIDIAHDGMYVDDTVMLERLITLYPEVVERAVREVAPHHIAAYAIQLARAFNTFYAQHKIAVIENGAAHRVRVVQSVGVILRDALCLLGIEAPERM